MIESPSYGNPLLLVFAGVRQLSVPTRWTTVEPRIIAGSESPAVDQAVFFDWRTGVFVVANSVSGLTGEDAHKYGDFVDVTKPGATEVGL